MGLLNKTGRNEFVEEQKPVNDNYRRGWEAVFGSGKKQEQAGECSLPGICECNEFERDDRCGCDSTCGLDADYANSPNK